MWAERETGVSPELELKNPAQTWPDFSYEMGFCVRLF